MENNSKILIMDDQHLAEFCQSFKIFVDVYLKSLIELKPISSKFVNFTDFMSTFNFFPCIHSKVIAI